MLILVRHAMPAFGPVPLLVATHGMAMTVWLTARLGLADPGGFWEDLQFPDAYLVDTAGGTVRRIADLP